MSTLTLDTDVAVLGMSYPNEQDAVLQAFRDCRPLANEQLDDIRRGAAKAVEGNGGCWWNPGNERRSRRSPSRPLPGQGTETRRAENTVKLASSAPASRSDFVDNDAAGWSHRFYRLRGPSSGSWGRRWLTRQRRRFPTRTSSPSGSRGRDRSACGRWYPEGTFLSPVQAPVGRRPGAARLRFLRAPGRSRPGGVSQ